MYEKRFFFVLYSKPRLKLFGYLTVSEVPKPAPIARKYDSRHELEEVKSTEQMKEDVSVIFHNTFVIE